MSSSRGTSESPQPTMAEVIAADAASATLRPDSDDQDMASDAESVTSSSTTSDITYPVNGNTTKTPDHGPHGSGLDSKGNAIEIRDETNRFLGPGTSSGSRRFKRLPIQVHFRKGLPLETRRQTKDLPNPPLFYLDLLDLEKRERLTESGMERLAKHFSEFCQRMRALVPTTYLANAGQEDGAAGSGAAAVSEPTWTPTGLTWPEGCLPYVQPTHTSKHSWFLELNPGNYEELMCKALRAERSRLGTKEGEEGQEAVHVFLYLQTGNTTAEDVAKAMESRRKGGFVTELAAPLFTYAGAGAGPLSLSSAAAARPGAATAAAAVIGGSTNHFTGQLTTTSPGSTTARPAQPTASSANTSHPSQHSFQTPHSSEDSNEGLGRFSQALGQHMAAMVENEMRKYLQGSSRPQDPYPSSSSASQQQHPPPPPAPWSPLTNGAGSGLAGQKRRAETGGEDDEYRHVKMKVNGVETSIQLSVRSLKEALGLL